MQPLAGGALDGPWGECWGESRRTGRVGSAMRVMVDEASQRVLDGVVYGRRCFFLKNFFSLARVRVSLSNVSERVEYVIIYIRQNM